MKISKRTAVVAVATVGATIAASGLAFAFWTTTGSGNASAKAAGFNVPGVTINTTATPATALYPGGTTDLLVLATNNNPFPVTVTLAEDATRKITSGNAGCSETVNGAHTVTGVSFTGGSFTLLANTTTAVSKTIANSVSMTNASPTACISAVFDIPVTSSAASN